MIDSAQTILVYPDKQFVESGLFPATEHLVEEVYAAALDSLVITCVDIIPLYNGKMLLSRRTRLPQATWWINGGRMRRGELYADAARRLMATELGLVIDPDRFHLLGFYNLLWAYRAQAPHHHGCQTLSVTHTVSLTASEVARLSLNEEYDAAEWLAPSMIRDASAERYHPALTAMARDLLTRDRPEDYDRHLGHTQNRGMYACASHLITMPEAYEPQSLMAERGPTSP